ncbi:hypothetical protein A2311_04710 [candidate division WOR-1 bacterium RIFOXYB2_FULL_48_7]|uniref:Class II aldolase/adducin N-terminal domain-containing protein n=1 Tax=candidate division WOR-1 bacterium RIFOXYB2_FULL_48_7 TaxID=1802583 RepID=A0A1F4TS97_UNCSA|nr:MAG: hypothetical protein A2311_04710 [candidate division WOR-1 bacterium RIFOXYB2_FULL_48_7]
MLHEFKKIGEFMFREGLVDSHGGDMSLRQGDRIFITSREAMLGDLEDNDIVEVGLEAGGGDERASKEVNTHRAIYKETGAQAIIHTHSPQAVAISLTDNKIIPQDAEGLAVFRSAAIVRAHQAIASEEVNRLLPTFLQGNSIVAVVRGHGVFAIGKEMEEAYKYASCLENSCRILVAMRASASKSPQAAKESHPPSRPNRPMPGQRSAIPPGIGVMDRSRYNKR